MPIPQQHGLGHRLVLSEGIFDGRRGHVLAGPQDQQVLQSPNDLEPTRIVKRTDIPGPQPTLGIEGGEYNDRILRLNPATGEFVEYLLPLQTNVRRVFVDNSTTPVTFWVGNNHNASIVKLEPLEP